LRPARMNTKLSLRSASIVTNACLAVLALLAIRPVAAQFTLDREPIGPSTRKTGLVITEFMYNPRLLPGIATNQTLDFIELYNSKPWAEDIGGFTLRSTPDATADGLVVYTFPTN